MTTDADVKTAKLIAQLADHVAALTHRVALLEAWARGEVPVSDVHDDAAGAPPA